MAVILSSILDISLSFKHCLWDKTVVRRFVSERAIDVQTKSISNGFDDIHFHWTSIAVHLEIVAQLIK